MEQQNVIICPIFEYPPEIWLPITENIIPEIMNYYEISNYGNVYSKATRHMLKPFMRSGYWYVNLSRKFSISVYGLHRLVLSTFSGTMIYTSLEPNHLDFDTNNNCLWNLEWSTRIENLNYNHTKIPSGRGRCSGELAHSNIISDNEAGIIGKLLEQGIKPRFIIDALGRDIKVNIIESIRSGSCWYEQSGARELTFLNNIIINYFGRDKLDKIHGLLDKSTTNDLLILQAIGFDYNEKSYVTTHFRRMINLLDKIKFERLRGNRL